MSEQYYKYLIIFLVCFLILTYLPIDKWSDQHIFLISFLVLISVIITDKFNSIDNNISLISKNTVSCASCSQTY